MADQRVVHITLDDEIYQRILILAKASEKPVEAVAADAISAYLRNHQPGGA